MLLHLFLFLSMVHQKYYRYIQLFVSYCNGKILRQDPKLLNFPFYVELWEDRISDFTLLTSCVSFLTCGVLVFIPLILQELVDNHLNFCHFSSDMRTILQTLPWILFCKLAPLVDDYQTNNGTGLTYLPTLITNCFVAMVFMMFSLDIFLFYFTVYLCTFVKPFATFNVCERCHINTFLLTSTFTNLFFFPTLLDLHYPCSSLR